MTLHSCHDGYGPTATGGTYADMVHSCCATLHYHVAASFSCAGWKGVGKTTKGSGKADGHVTEQGAGRFGRWRRIADAASKQSLRCVHHLGRQFAQDAKVPTEQHAESACFLQGTQPYAAASHINE